MSVIDKSKFNPALRPAQQQPGRPFFTGQPQPAGQPYPQPSQPGQPYSQPQPARSQPRPPVDPQPQQQRRAYAAAAEKRLVVENVFKSYKTKKVVQGVSLSVARGESVGLLGPNGAGKTTVFYMITGLVVADQGRITIDGHIATKLPMYQRARLGVGYLPQEASIFRGLTVEQNIRAVLEVVEKSRKLREKRLDQLLDEFKIARLRKERATSLSGGERRRLEIARAIASNPSYMLLDEPFAGIDPLSIGDIKELVTQLKQRGIGVLITDHNVRETLALIDRGYIITTGRVLAEGSPSEIIRNEKVKEAYIGNMFADDGKM